MVEEILSRVEAIAPTAKIEEVVQQQKQMYFFLLTPA
jgi:hypothetical protein